MRKEKREISTISIVIEEKIILVFTGSTFVNKPDKLFSKDQQLRGIKVPVSETYYAHYSNCLKANKKGWKASYLLCIDDKHVIIQDIIKFFYLSLSKTKSVES